MEVYFGWAEVAGHFCGWVGMDGGKVFWTFFDRSVGDGWT